MAFDIIVSGHLCADLLPATSHIPLSALASPGKLFEVGPLAIGTGGAVSNTGLALQRLGVNVGLMTTVGDDLLGRVIIAKLKERDERLGDYIKIRQNIASSYSIILSPQNADRIILHCAGNNIHFDLPDIDFELVNTAKVFHLGYPPLLPHLYANDGENMQTMYRRIQEMGVLTSLDMAHPDPSGTSGQVDWQRVLGNVLPYVDIFLPSIEEIVFMLRRADYDRWHGDVLAHISRNYLRQFAGELLAMGVAISGFKLGEYGMYLRTTSDTKQLARIEHIGNVADWRDVEHWHPRYLTTVVGTIGAGDSAYGGFLAALVRGLNPQDALQIACAVGACNVEAVDATSGVQSWEATQARIRAGWPTADLSLTD